MVRHIHMDVIRARAASMAAEIGGDPELIAHELAEAHARLGKKVHLPATEPSVQKHYADGKLIRVQRFVGHLPVPKFEDTVQV